MSVSNRLFPRLFDLRAVPGTVFCCFFLISGQQFITSLLWHICDAAHHVSKQGEQLRTVAMRGQRRVPYMSLKVHEIASFEFDLKISLDICFTHFIGFNSRVNCLMFFKSCVSRVSASA